MPTGIAPGSIGFIRQRCLDRLRKKLEEAGFSVSGEEGTPLTDKLLRELGALSD